MPLFLKTVGDWSLNICYLIHAQTAKPILYYLLFHSNKPLWHFTMDNQRRKRGNKDERAKKWKVIMLKLKFEQNINGIIEERDDCGNVNYCHSRDSTYTARGTSEKWIDWHTLGQGGSCDTKNKDIPEEVTLAKSFTWKELSEIAHDTENAMDKMLEADSNLEGVWQFTKALKRCLLSIRSPMRRRQAS